MPFVLLKLVLSVVPPRIYCTDIVYTWIARYTPSDRTNNRYLYTARTPSRLWIQCIRWSLCYAMILTIIIITTTSSKQLIIAKQSHLAAMADLQTNINSLTTDQIHFRAFQCVTVHWIVILINYLQFVIDYYIRIFFPICFADPHRKLYGVWFVCTHAIEL